MTTHRDELKARFIEELRIIYPKGSKVYTVLRHATAMRRTVSPIGISKNGDHLQIADWSYKVATVLGWNLDRKRAGIIVTGCGMDMGFHLVHSLSSILYEGDGFALKHEWI
jgi:hypothetical protein